MSYYLGFWITYN